MLFEGRYCYRNGSVWGWLGFHACATVMVGFLVALALLDGYLFVGSLLLLFEIIWLQPLDRVRLRSLG